MKVNSALHPPLKALLCPLIPGLNPLWTLKSSLHPIYTPDPAQTLLWERALVRLHSSSKLQYSVQSVSESFSTGYSQ